LERIVSQDQNDPVPEPVDDLPAWPSNPFGTTAPARSVPEPVDAGAAAVHADRFDAPLDAQGPVLPEPVPAPWVDPWSRPPVRARRRAWRAWLVVPAVLLALVAGAAGGVLGARWGASPLVDLPPAATARPDGGQLTGVASIAANVLPSVVLIQLRGSTGEATGSGFVLREDGYLLTNAHVANADVGSGRTTTVVFADGSHADATLVGYTTDYDLAVLKVDRQGLTPLALGDSDQVVVGDPVVAIGAPLGLQGTVTTGIVSALNRPVTAGDVNSPAFINAIQTDAAINPGNSGGPLVDAVGEVIGITSAIAQAPGAVLSGTAANIGLGFAIPANQARRTAEQIIETGKATYPIIGVLVDSQYTGEGVQVLAESSSGQQAVVPGGPADRAGIRPGDVILAIDGRPVTQPDELIVAIRAKQPGDSVVLRVRTGDQERDVRVVLSETTSG
jgi:putative serine protease PepD